MEAPHRPIAVREFAVPDLPPSAALLRTSFSEVCGTDVHLWHGRLSGVPYPIIPGHVSAGVLDRVRGDIEGIDGSALTRRGSRRLLRRPPHVRPLPRLHRPSHADALHAPAASTGSPIRPPRVCSADGREFVYLEPGVGIARLPDTISFESYIGGGCGLLTAVHILERAALRPGDTVLVQGTGAVGLSAIALARLGGASTIFAIGAPQERLDLARADGR